MVAGLVWLWPSAQRVDIPLPMQSAGGGAFQTEAGTVIRQDLGACGSASLGKPFADEPQAPRTNAYECQRSIVAIESGPDEGKRTLFEIAPGPGQPDLRVGDEIRIVRSTDPTGAPIYGFDDYSRGLPLTVIVIAFAVVIVAVARWRGLRALIGLVFAFAVLVKFLLPALLDGKPAIPVALVAGALILYVVLYLAHGLNLRTSSALLGTLTSMGLAAFLSWLTLKVTHLTGLSEEQNTNVATYLEHVSITGLLLAGFIIGTLGVLNDVTITQASAAFELAALDEKANRRSIFGAAMRVGRDHIASTVYTLVLAYAGGALPLLLIFSVAGRNITDVLTGDAVGIEIARSAVGGIALALSVPLTTGIAVMLARPFGHKPEPERPAKRSRTAAKRPASAGTPRAAARTGSMRKAAAADEPRTTAPAEPAPPNPYTGVVRLNPNPAPEPYDPDTEDLPVWPPQEPPNPPNPPRGGGRHSRP
ncbi:YibE/F family protein [Nocardia sp. IFM 10818]